MTNALYYGDNLRVLRESIASESVDLIYLDPRQMPPPPSAPLPRRTPANSTNSTSDTTVAG